MLIAGALLLLLAYAMLIPGLTEPMLSLVGTVEKSKLVDIGREIVRDSANTSGLMRGLADRFISSLDASGTVDAFDKSNSILGTAQDLWSGGNAFVALLILTFSVLVPLVKGGLILATLLPLGAQAQARFAAVADASSKWSMADVFVIAIFIAFLAGNGLSDTRGLVDVEASLGAGFWWFLGYCLISVAATQLIAFGRARSRSAGLRPPPARALPAPAPASARRTSAKKSAAKKKRAPVAKRTTALKPRGSKG